MEGRENGALSTGAGGLPGECRLSRVSCKWADLGGGVTIEEGAYVRTENVRRLVRLDKRYEESCTSQVPSRDPQMAAAYQVDVLFSLVW